MDTTCPRSSASGGECPDTQSERLPSSLGLPVPQRGGFWRPSRHGLCWPVYAPPRPLSGPDALTMCFLPSSLGLPAAQTHLPRPGDCDPALVWETEPPPPPPPPLPPLSSDLQPHLLPLGLNLNLGEGGGLPSKLVLSLLSLSPRHLSEFSLHLCVVTPLSPFNNSLH